jgi:hypothetical protein
MKLLKSFIIFFMFFSNDLKSQEKLIVDWNYKHQSFRDFAAEAERRHGVGFFYKDEWIENLKIPDIECKSITCILEDLFRGTSLHYYIDKDNNIIVSNFLLRSLNDTLYVENRSLNDLQFADPGSLNSRGDSISYQIGNASDRFLKGNVTLTGHIINKVTKEPVAGVTIHEQTLLIGANSNQAGFYSITLPRGIHILNFSFVGMQGKTIKIALYSGGKIDVEMSNQLIQLREVLISDHRNVLDRSETGLERINIKTLKLLPTSLGETDILKSLTLIAGVKTVGEGSAGFNVRGGSADQNLILLHGAPLYSSSHLFGFFSAVNSDIIQDVSLYKGGIPGKYGGRISSVLDIETKEGNKREFRGSAGISPVTTHLLLEGPIIKDILSYILAGRTTYSNWVFGLIKDPIIHNSRASFYDLNGGITFNPDKKNKIELSSYLSDDNFRFISTENYNYSNSILGLRWWHSFNSRFYSSVSINNSVYGYEMGSRDVPQEEYILSHTINSTGLKSDFNLTHGRNELNFGLDLTRYSVNPGSIQPGADSSLIVSDFIERERAYEGALYLEDRYTFSKFLTFSLGVRMSAFASMGPRDVLVYNPGFSKSSSGITDTLEFGSGKFVSKYAGPELRASLNFRLSDNMSVKVNYNRTRQYLHLLTNTISISPTDTWKLCDSYLKPETGDQYAAGFYQLLFSKKLEFSAEAYFKEIRNMVEYKGGTSLTMVKNIEQHLINAKGKASGVEFSLKNTQGKFLLNVAYTYSRSFVKSQGAFKDETINSGNWYPANFDKPHDLAVTFNYLYSRRLSLSGNLVYNTGRPVTYPLSVYKMRNFFLVDYSDRNKYRLPYTFRFDISCKISGNLKVHKIAHPDLILSVYNLFGRENPYSIYFRKEEEILKGHILSLFGRPIPSVTFRFDF